LDIGVSFTCLSFEDRVLFVLFEEPVGAVTAEPPSG
jgi:hypothetical protein